MNELSLSVSQAIDGFNELLDQAYPFVIIEGEVSSFKVNQNKFVFFDIKDQDATLGCFMMLFDLKMPIQDGMKVKVLATPKITKWGKFSLTVKNIMPIGEGSLKKSQDLLKQKLENEGLFDTSRKRILPKIPGRIGVVSSSQAAGYKDFIKIVEDRWGGLEILLTDITVQGIDAPAQIVGAIKYLNEVANDLDVIVVIRGGGSADDLAAFSNEDVVRAIAGSRTPTLVGVGHEVDISLADLVADKRASTPK
ncbi:exodeoxyribonuclease VII large subunit [Candidatus Nomurabacteria bacterium]|nr:exodeoxyribonuclease VII large subunit [Candidatus Nomurabacteria bacterium]